MCFQGWRGHWTVYNTSTQSFYLIVALKTLGTFIGMFKTITAETFQVIILITEGILLFIIIENVYKFIVHCLMSYP